MTYARATTLDPNPSGDTTKGAIVDKLDVDLSNIFTHLNTHEAKASDTHGRTGALVDTSSAQTITGKTISACTLTGATTCSGATLTGGNTVNQTILTPTFTGSVTCSGATLTGGNTVNQTITTPTIVTPTLTGAVTCADAILTGGNTVNQTITTPVITGGTIQNTVATSMSIYTPTITGGSSTNMTITTPTITGDVACSHLTPILGSDADGDLWYRASGIVARLAKGAADTKLFMNAGATAPEWAIGAKVGTLTRAMDAASGDVAYTTVGFKPSAIIFLGCTAISICVGVDDGTDKRVVYALAASTVYGNSNAGSCVGLEDINKYQRGYIKTFDSDGFTITWLKGSTPASASFEVYYLALR